MCIRDRLGNVLGQQADYLWHKEESLGNTDAVVVPGGFSYGDYLRTGSIAQFSPVMNAVKREFEPEEIIEDIWTARAAEAGVSLEDFFRIAKDLDKRRVVGRFSTFLEHVKRHSSGKRVTKFNALFHWAVPAGREIEAGGEVGRHDIMTHAYWREGGPDFHNVNVMGVAHGTDKEMVLKHKGAIDQHLDSVGIPVSYTNVFWGGRSEIKPSEISPIAYREWCQKVGIDPETMRED